jgi:protein-S-isoprenylcysteine O-methyltransferase Ste14
MRSGSDYAPSMAAGSAPRKSGNAGAMAEITAAPQHERRNWFAIAALWLVVASWLALAFRLLTGDVFGIESPLDWLYVTAMLGAIVAAVAGLVAIRTRGDGWLAVTAFAMSLVIPGGYALVYLLVAVLVGGYDQILD